MANMRRLLKEICVFETFIAVSYTHLDVYKRQLRAYGQGSRMIPMEKAKENGLRFFEELGVRSLEEARQIAVSYTHLGV